MKRIVTLSLLTLSSVLLLVNSGCEGWEYVQDDASYWSDSYSWVNFAGMYRDSAGQYLVRKHGRAAALNRSETLKVMNGLTSAFAGSTDQSPVVKGSVTVTDGTESFTDVDGDGSFSSSLTAGSGSCAINYETGVIEGAFTLPPATGSSVRVTYQYWGTGTSENPQSGSTGTEIFTFNFQQQGNLITIVDNDGMTYTGRLGSVSSTAGTEGPSSAGLIVADFVAHGVSDGKKNVTITGSMQAVYLRVTETASGASGVTVTRYFLQDRTMTATWIETGPGSTQTGDINGVTTEIAIDVKGTVSSSGEL